MLLSEKANVNNKPELEIYADDVKCAHGATIGQLDHEALFYLTSRGIAPEHARRMLIASFATRSLDRIENDHIRQFMEHVMSTAFCRIF